LLFQIMLTALTKEKIIQGIGVIEILIGSITILFNLVTLALHQNPKAPTVFFFVIVAGTISTLIGIGILKHNRRAFELLVYFSSVVFLSKILLWMDVIHLNGALETTIPSNFKRIVSLTYHGLLIAFLTRPNVRMLFYRQKS
jgi:hypothetical protein